MLWRDSGVRLEAQIEQGYLVNCDFGAEAIILVLDLTLEKVPDESVCA